MKTENNNSKKQKKHLFGLESYYLQKAHNRRHRFPGKTGLSPAMVNYVVKQLIALGAQIFIGLMDEKGWSH